MFQTVKENTFKLFLPISKLLQPLKRKKKKKKPQLAKIPWQIYTNLYFSRLETLQWSFRDEQHITQVLAFVQGSYTELRKSKQAKINSREWQQAELIKDAPAKKIIFSGKHVDIYPINKGGAVANRRRL